MDGRVITGLWGIAIGLGFWALMEITNAEEIGAAASIFVVSVVFTAMVWSH